MNQYRVSVGEADLKQEEVIAFLSKIYGPNYYDSYSIQKTTISNEPSTSPDNFILARSPKGDLIGIVRIVERNISLGMTVLSAGCISSVGVEPEWRGQGVASNLMNTAMKVMKSRGMDISVLYGRRAVDGFYTRFGYYGIGRYIDLEILSPVASRTSMQAVPWEKNNIEACMGFYGKAYGGLAGSVMRDLPIWKYLFSRQEKGVGKEKLLICQLNKKNIGYLVTANHKLIEMSLPPDDFQMFFGLLSGLDIKLISIHPRHSFYIYCRTHMHTIQKERFALEGGYMGRIVSLESLLKKLGPTLACRAAVMGASNKTIRLFRYQVDLKDGRVSQTSKPNDLVFDKPETAVQFLLGVIYPQDIIGVSWPAEKPWIPYLFPNLYYHTSSFDEV